MSTNVERISALANNLNLGMQKEDFGGFLEGLSASTQPATQTTAGIVKQGAAVADAAGANPTAAEFKALLDSLRAAGVISLT